LQHIDSYAANIIGPIIFFHSCCFSFSCASF